MKEKIKQELIEAYKDVQIIWDKLGNIHCGGENFKGCKGCPLDNKTNVPCRLGVNFFK